MGKGGGRQSCGGYSGSEPTVGFRCGRCRRVQATAVPELPVIRRVVPGTHQAACVREHSRHLVDRHRASPADSPSGVGTAMHADTRGETSTSLPGKRPSTLTNREARLGRASGSLRSCVKSPLADFGLLFDDAAGDAIARVARRIGHQVICLRVDHQSGAAIVEERIRAVAERDGLVDERRFRLPVLAHHKIQQVTGVRVGILGIIDSVVRHGRIEMAAGRGERRSFTLADRVDVDAVLSRRQLRDADRYLHAILCGSDFGGTDFRALCVDDVRVRRFWRGVG